VFVRPKREGARGLAARLRGLVRGAGGEEDGRGAAGTRATTPPAAQEALTVEPDETTEPKHAAGAEPAKTTEASADAAARLDAARHRLRASITPLEDDDDGP